ncbi:serum paraoxonase/arylesterase 1-like isoform X1 [Mercenaria mercenaria]|uniref:serum paraoxonase/arylesterase 1-like isoform X1 n=2 Tax=Mercenaria mercenaria TaxID=6596 RepID=UPI00234E3853|nr:serum paraoxonase/arylesterase 1-like isoform X1 [Mercenaria mercenaria]XP_053394252.1 serum paraoxonase/arylesterase 1-like isoform X1 [Mercenaria mercenaria]XP_053394253.1 serum paraoxonase/arylesterase 1-like isoform X1 [Mercenaria mercenaria]
MFSQVVTIALFGFGLKYFLNYRDWLDWNKDQVFNIKPGACKTVIQKGGAEDATHIGNGIVLMSTGLTFFGPPGQIKALDLNNDKLITLNMTNVPARSDFLSGPHGITKWRDPDTDQLFLYVICHPKPEDRIEVFEVLKSLTLKYIRTITDPKFELMNDLVAVGNDKFYITKSIHFRNFMWYNWEMLSGLKFGGVFYYDGHKAREVASGYYIPNGINISPDKKVVYVAEWGTKTIRGFKRDSSNSLVEIWSMNTGTGIDNIEVDPDTGDLWIGCHPVTWRLVDMFYGSLHPSQVVRVKMQDNAVSEMEVIYQDDGTNCAGSSVATYAAGKLVIGTVLKQAVVCDVNYLTPN